MVLIERFFKFHRRSVSKLGMHTFVVVSFLNEKGKPNLNIFQRPVFPEVNLFNLECFKKTFRGGVVIGIASAVHADQKTVLL